MKGALSLALGGLVSATAFASVDRGFANPPDSAKPQVWWHWMAGNVTRAGITADLEAMAEVGIGGAILFDAGLGTRWGVPEGSLAFNTPEWYATVKFAAEEAKRLGLELGMANCSGWANSGGPWNTPYHAMKTVCHTGTKVKGGSRVEVKLPQAEDTVGFYADIAVVAFPTPREAFEIRDWTFKCFSNPGRRYDVPDTRVAPAGAVVAKESVIDLTASAKAGTLVWDAPAGDWTVLRVGYRATGRKNGTGTRLGKGLECDKLSKEALRIHWANYVGKTVEALGPELAGPNGPLKTVLNDSYEVGTQNWTHGFENEFKRHAGYDILPYLPALCGRVIDSVAATERFYRDFRLAVTDAFVENYAGEMRTLAHALGLQLAIEPYGEIPSDDLLYGEKADIPTAEFWAKLDSPRWVRQAASIAHAKGRRIVAAESFTTNAREGRWQNTPWSMKAKCDWVYSEGLNRIIYHRFAHQPWTDPARLPGMTMGPFGTHFDRTQTWWRQAKPWLEYQRRCQYMLQEGRFVCDVAWYCPAGYLYINWGGNPHGMPTPVIDGFAYDFVSGTSLADMKVEGGRLVLPSGQSYSMLVLPEKAFGIPPDGAAKLAALKAAGATVLSFEEAKGVLAHRTPDFAVAGAKTRVNWIHRRDDACDWYFVASPDESPKRVVCRFRTAGRRPELWNAETGEMKSVDTFAAKDGVTSVPLTFGPCGSWFVVFREKAYGAPRELPPEKPFKAKAVSFKLVKAEYGVFGEAAYRPADVTPRLAAAVKDGRLFYDKIWHGDFRIADPAENRSKVLRVTYLENGVEKVAEAKEHGVLYIPKPDTTLLDLPGEQRAEVAVTGDWSVTFPTDWYVGGKTLRRVSLPHLQDWTAFEDADLRYFSGTAAYDITVDVSKLQLRPGERVFLDLGDVKNFADVTVNGKTHPALWKPPFRLDITSSLIPHPSSLSFSIRVTNLWPNRIIGDDFKAEDSTFEPGKPIMERHLNGWPKFILEGKPSPSGKYTFATWKHWTRDDKPLPSGLLGPVVLRVVGTTRLEKPAAIPREEGLYRSQLHRGGGGKYPDNALETFLWCWGHGCTPEADARLTKDGVAIAMHDSVLDRIATNFPARLRGVQAKDMTWAELRDVDIGSKWGARYATYRLATMESVFAAMAGRPDRLLYLDEKGAPPKMMAEMAARFGVVRQTYFCSPSWRKVVEWRKYAPDGRSMVWLGNFPKSNSPENVARTEAFVGRRLDEMEAFQFDGIDQVQIHIRTDLTKDDPFCPSTPFIRNAIARLHRYGVTVNGVTWTHGTDEKLYYRMWDLGFDHFTTDYPETLFKVIARLGKRAD